MTGPTPHQHEHHDPSRDGEERDMPHGPNHSAGGADARDTRNGTGREVVRDQQSLPGRVVRSEAGAHRATPAARLVEFLIRRLRPGPAVGLTLTVGAVLVFALGVVFAKLLNDVLEGDGTASFDRPVEVGLAAVRVPWLVTVMHVITDIGSPVGVGSIAVLIAAGLCWSLRRFGRWWRPLVVTAVGAGGIGLLGTLIKDLVSRERPPMALRAIGEDGFSFPSGHATGSTTVALLAAFMITRWVVARPGPRAAVWAAAGVFIAAVGASRLYLGVHYPTDVAAGWLLGAAWALVVALAVAVWEDHPRTPNSRHHLQLLDPDPDPASDRVRSDVFGGEEATTPIVPRERRRR